MPVLPRCNRVRKKARSSRVVPKEEVDTNMFEGEHRSVKGRIVYM
jgi:hypothetical protein